MPKQQTIKTDNDPDVGKKEYLLDGVKYTWEGAGYYYYSPEEETLLCIPTGMQVADHVRTYFVKLM